MGIRLTGINSGMDTDSIVQALMSAQSYKKTKIEAKKTKLEWKKDLWSELNTKIYNFYTNSLSKIRLQGAFKTKAATSSDNSKVTATATSSAAEGTYKVKVNSLASAQYVTSGALKGAWARDKDGNLLDKDGKLIDKDGNLIDKDGNYVDANGDPVVSGTPVAGNGHKEAKVSNSTRLVDLLDKDGNSTFKAGTQIKVTTEKGGYATLLVDENIKVSDFITMCSNAGVNASFDADQQRLFMNSGASGANQKFEITAGALHDDQKKAISDLRNAVGYEYMTASNKAAVDKIFDKLQSGKITEEDANTSLEKYLHANEKAAVTAYYRKEYTENYNKQYFQFGVDDKPVLDADGKKQLNEAAAKADWVAAQVAAGSKKTTEAAEAAWDKLTNAQKISKIEAMVTSKVNADIKADVGSKIADGLVNGIASADDPFLINSSADRNTALGTGITDFVTEMVDHASNIDTSAGNAQLSSLGLGLNGVTGVATPEIEGDTSSMVVVAASDAAITFNGATLTSSTSTLTVNGLTLNILDTTPGSEISISVTKDTSAIYDTVKDFISDYNDILKTMNSYYNAATAKGYDVLTDEQKEAMSDDEIEKWEDKIKSSLLRRDDTLGSIISSFSTNMMGSYTASDGKRYSLASLGISTSAKNWYEGGLLHIKGDEDDAEYMDEENKLEAMLTKDPELAMEIMNGLTGNLYKDLQKKMQFTRMSSALTFYNDKEMNSQLSDYSKQITNWEKKLAILEERYYSQFTAMEKAMASLNSQQNYFSSMMG